MAFRNIVISLLLVGLFAFAMFTFAVNFAYDNSVNNSLANDPYLNTSFIKIQSNLNTTEQIAQDQRTSFESDSPLAAFGGLVFFSIVQAGRVIVRIPVTMFGVITETSTRYLGIDPVITGIISAILIITLIMVTWRMIRVGE